MTYSDKAYSCSKIPNEQEKRAIKEALLVLALSNIEPNKHYALEFYEKEGLDPLEGEFYSARVRAEEAKFMGFRFGNEETDREKVTEYLHNMNKLGRICYECCYDAGGVVDCEPIKYFGMCALSAAEELLKEKEDVAKDD